MSKDGKALAHIAELGGKAYKPGDKIPAAVIQQITPQVLRALVDNGKIEVAGMEQSAGGSGGQAHIMARLDALQDQNKKLVAGFKELTDRVLVLEGKNPAALKAAKNEPAAPAAAKPVSRRNARTKEK